MIINRRDNLRTYSFRNPFHKCTSRELYQTASITNNVLLTSRKASGVVSTCFLYTARKTMVSDRTKTDGCAAQVSPVN